MRIIDCAHCGDDHPLRAAEGRVCRGCLQQVCDGCYSASTPTDCQHYGDPAKGSPGRRHRAREE